MFEDKEDYFEDGVGNKKRIDMICKHFVTGKCRKNKCQWSHAIDPYGKSNPANLKWATLDALNLPSGEPFDANQPTVGNNLYANEVGPIVWTWDTKYLEDKHDVESTPYHPEIPPYSRATATRYTRIIFTL